MKPRIIKIFLLTVLFTVIGSTNSLKAQKIFFTDSIHESEVIVYIVNDSTIADLYVSNVDSVKKINKDGLWFPVAYEWQADKKVFITTNAWEADIKIYYVSNSKKAGWIDRNKRYLMKINK